MKYDLVRPCAHCPFRNDIPPYLTADRVAEIWDSLERGEFACHETTKHDEEGEVIRSDDESHCAGALILMEKSDRSSQMMRICERIGMYDHTKLDMTSPVFDAIDDMIDCQEG